MNKLLSMSLTAVTVTALTACGHHDVDLSGVKIGMTREEVASAAPAGSALYCKGQGDLPFEEMARLPDSTSSTYCTWATSAPEGRYVAPVSIGGVQSVGTYWVFGADGRIASASVAAPSRDYKAVLKSMKDKYGSPDVSEAFGGATWIAKNGTLKVSQEGQFTNTDITLILLKPTRDNPHG